MNSRSHRSFHKIILSLFLSFFASTSLANIPAITKYITVLKNNTPVNLTLTVLGKIPVQLDSDSLNKVLMECPNNSIYLTPFTLSTDEDYKTCKDISIVMDGGASIHVVSLSSPNQQLLFRVNRCESDPTGTPISNPFIKPIDDFLISHTILFDITCKQ